MLDNLKFSSIFSTIQGEGSNCGKLTTFIRFHTDDCFPNKRFCSFCDTIYKKNYQPSLNISEIREYLQENRPSMITITGGEPFSTDIDELIEFLEICRIYTSYIEVETNGSYFQNLSFFQFDRIKKLINQFNVSPKLSSSNVNFDYKIDTFEYFKNKSIFKFVVSEKRFQKEVNEIEQWENILSLKENIWLMPLTPSTKEFQKNLFDFCVKMKYNYSQRLHIDLFGNIEKEI